MALPVVCQGPLFAFGDVCSGLVALRRWGNLRCKNLTQTREWLSSYLQVVTAPCYRFFIANTPHHRLLAGVLFSRAARFSDSDVATLLRYFTCKLSTMRDVKNYQKCSWQRDISLACSTKMLEAKTPTRATERYHASQAVVRRACDENSGERRGDHLKIFTQLVACFRKNFAAQVPALPPANHL